MTTQGRKKRERALTLPREIGKWPHRWKKLFSVRLKLLKGDAGMPYRAALVAAEADVRRAAKAIRNENDPEMTALDLGF